MTTDPTHPQRTPVRLNNLRSFTNSLLYLHVPIKPRLWLLLQDVRVTQKAHITRTAIRSAVSVPANKACVVARARSAP